MIPIPDAIRAHLAARFAADPARMARLGGGGEESDGVVFTFPDGDTTRLLKILALPDDGSALACFEERLRFTRFLGERGAPVVFSLPSLSGALYEVVRGDGRVWTAYRMDIAPGRVRGNNEWDEPFFTRWGRAVGMTHRLTRSFPAWDAPLDPATGTRLLTWEAEWAGFDSMCEDEAVRREWRAIRGELEQLPRGPELFGFVHNDPHLQNVMDDGARLTLLDFDVASQHWFASDIAVASQSVLFAHSGGFERRLQDGERLRRFLGCFLEGYAREHEPSAELLARLDLFIAYRRILLFVVFQGHLAANPAARESWARMILDRPEIVGKIS